MDLKAETDLTVDRGRKTAAVAAKLRAGSGRQILDSEPWRLWIGPAIIFVFFAVVGSSVGQFWASVATTAIVQALLLLSVGILYNRARLLSLCPFSFAAVGAWLASWFSVHAPVPFVLMLVIGGVAALPVGVLVGLLSLRLRSMSLAVATLGVATATDALLTKFPFPGELSDRLVAAPAFASTPARYFLFALIVFVVIAVIMVFVMKSRLGSTWITLRSERATAAGGTSVLWAKLSIFCLSAMLASVAGVLNIGQYGMLDTSTFSEMASLSAVAAAVFIGAGRMEGAVAGGIGTAVLSQAVTVIGISADVPTALFGVGAVFALRNSGDGIVDTLQSRRATRRARRAAAAQRDRPLEAASRAAPPATGPTTAAPQAAATNSAAGNEVAGAAAPPPSATWPVAARRPRTPNGRRGAAENALEIADLTVRYGTSDVVDRVSLNVPVGAVAALIGPNGAGKTTLIDATTGFVRYRSGRVCLAGRTIDSLAPHRRAQAGLRRTFQQSRAPDGLTIDSYLRLLARRRIAGDEIGRILALFGCPPRTRLIGSLDVPARRLVELAAVIAARPVAVLLDEPAAGLGEDESLQLAERIRRIPELFGISVLLVEHDMAVVRKACSIVTVLDYGKVIATGGPARVMASREVRLAYFGEEEPS
jgi:branched-chain amino acid transport system permease protein